MILLVLKLIGVVVSFITFCFSLKLAIECKKDYNKKLLNWKKTYGYDFKNRKKYMK